MTMQTLYQAKASKSQEISQLSEASQDILFQCSSVFPFTLFPDSISVDKKKVTIVYSLFFFSKSVFTILLEDIRTVKVDSGLFFGTLSIEVAGYEQNPQPLNFLPKFSAFKIRDIIMGLVAARREEIGIGKINKKELSIRAKKIGQAHKDVMGV